jgi:hypothetical protein
MGIILSFFRFSINDIKYKGPSMLTFGESELCPAYGHLVQLVWRENYHVLNIEARRCALKTYAKVLGSIPKTMALHLSISKGNHLPRAEFSIDEELGFKQ